MKNYLNVVLFSRDRSSQLELLLRSMKRFFKEFNETKINILYTYSNDEFKKGYNKLFTIHNDNNINYVKEINFKQDLINLMNNDKFTIFFVDDNVFKNPFSLEDKQFKIFSERNDIACLSLRLHTRLSYCYPANSIMKKPNFNNDMTWEWMNETYDYNYPMSLDGHIFYTKDILPYILNLNYSNPNSLEGNMSVRPINKKYMICYKESIIINNPVNKVQINNPNKHGNISQEYLNENFLNDYIISMGNIIGIDNESCHKELPVKLIKNNK